MELMLIFLTLHRNPFLLLRLLVLSGSPLLQALLPSLLSDIDEGSGLSLREPRRGRGIGASMNDFGYGKGGERRLPIRSE